MTREGGLLRLAWDAGAIAAIVLLLETTLVFTGHGRAAAQTVCADGTQPLGLVRSFTGEVRIGAQALEATGPFEVCSGDTVTVGPQSRAMVHVLAADTYLRLDENSQTRLEPAAEEESGVVDLLRGSLYFLSEVRRSLSIDTAYVTAGVEGTEVLLRQDEGGELEIIVLDGEVALTANDATQTLVERVTTGDRALIDTNGAVAQLDRPAPDGRYETLRAAVGQEIAWTLYYPDILTRTARDQAPLIDEAADLLAAGRADEAGAILATIQSPSSDAGVARALESIIALVQGRPGDADALADEALELAPDSPVPPLAKSLVRQAARDPAAAREFADLAASRAPGDPFVQARLAELALQDGFVRRAQTSALLSRDAGGDPLASLVLGFAELAALDANAAIPAFERALARDRSNPTAVLGLGLAQIRLGRLEEGSELISRAVALDPGRSLLRAYLGRAFIERNRDDRAGDQLSIARTLDPNDPTAPYFDALRKWKGNRPVEALADLQEAIALNDERATFRSELLLDQDRATRGAAVAQIYRELGFTRLGELEASKAVTADPASFAAHRFLAESYADRRRHQFGSTSELLRSQLLSPPNLDSAQARLQAGDLADITRSSPRTVGINEYSRLFDGNGYRVAGAGLGGSNDTYSGDIEAALLHHNVSLGVAAFRSETDGYRANNFSNRDAVSILGQWQVAPELSLQAEYWTRDENSGDLGSNIDESFDPDDNRHIEEDFFRVGANLNPRPGTNILGSFVALERDEDADFPDDDPIFPINLDARTKDEGFQGEAQLIQRLGRGTLTVGGGIYDFDTRQEFDFTDPIGIVPDSDEEGDYKQEIAYAYLDYPVLEDLTLTLGLGVSNYEDDIDGVDEDGEFEPRAGFLWEAIDGLDLRGAYSKQRQPRLAANRTIQPTTIAGFNQFFDDFRASESTLLAAGTDFDFRRLLGTSFDLWAGVEFSYRDIDSPFLFEGESQNDKIEENLLSAYFYLPLGRRWALSFEPFYEQIDCRDNSCAPATAGAIDELETLAAPIGLRFADPSGFFSGLTVTGILQDLIEKGGDAGNGKKESQEFALVDFEAGFRFPNRRGAVAFEIRNLFDENFGFQDDAFRSTQILPAPFAPERQFFISLSLRF